MKERADKMKEMVECKKCKVSVQRRSLYQHLQTHGEARHACKICGVYKGIRKSLLRSHQKNVHNIGADSVNDCVFCKKKLNAPSLLEDHLRTHTRERPFACNICTKECSNLYLLKKHREIHDLNRKPDHHCKHCSKKFCSRNGLRAHIQSAHAGEDAKTRFKCDTCSKGFISLQSLQFHCMIHKNEKPHSCEICKKNFIRKNNLEKHMLVHTGEQPYSCKICRKRFKHTTSLAQHTKTFHQKDKLQFKCGICRKAFVAKHKLERHLQSHTGEKLASCKICGKGFLDSANLSKHMRVHTKDESYKKYECKICKKKFENAPAVQIHIRAAHDKNKRFFCTICLRRFVQRQSLLIHWERFHPQDEQK